MNRARSTWRLLVAALRGDVDGIASGPLRRAIPLLAIPMALEMAGEALFALVDVFFVGHLGATAVATVGLTESMMALLYALAFGLAMPATAMVSRRVGEGEPEEAGRTAAQAIWVAAAVGAVVATSSAFAPQLLALMGGTPEVVREGWTFTALMLGASPLVILLFVGGGALRGAGDAAGAMRALWIANGINIALDPCLILGLGPFPELGLTGAALATVVGRSAGVVYQLWRLSRAREVSIRGRLAFRPDIARRLLRLSIGGTAQHLVETGSWVAVVRVLAEFGSVAVAGYTVAMRLVIFTLLPVWGFSNATATLVGQSLGAGDPARAERAVWLSGSFASVILAIVSLAFLLAPQPLAALFADDVAVVEVAGRGLFIIAFGYFFYGWVMVCQQAFNGAGDTTTPAWINVGCFWCLLIPLAWTLANPAGFGPSGVFIAIATGYSVSAMVSVLLVRRGRWKLAQA
ncbi:MAG: MATE family efflux transporter [Myxococcota bacterium]|nr:MATE family efflux transporter [Myxococcota bacterium]